MPGTRGRLAKADGDAGVPLCLPVRQGKVGICRAEGGARAPQDPRRFSFPASSGGRQEEPLSKTSRNWVPGPDSRLAPALCRMTTVHHLNPDLDKHGLQLPLLQTLRSHKNQVKGLPS